MEEENNEIEEVKVKKTNAENNKKYRMKKGDEINARRREQRNNRKAIQTPNIDYEVKELKKIVKLPEKGQTIDLAEATKNKYKRYIINFYKKYTGDDLKEDDDIILKIDGSTYKALNISKKFKILINKNIEAIKSSPTDTSNIYSIFRGIRGFIDIAKILYPYLKDYQEQYQEKRSVVKEEDKENLRISFDKEDILKNIEKIEDGIDRVIYGTMMMLRCRIGDLNHTKITKDKEEIKDENNNWIYKDKLYINKTKHKKKNIIEIPKEVEELYGEREGYLFGEEIKGSTLSGRIGVITKNIYGKSYTYLNIRHCYATYINGKGSSYKERYETAKQSGHSVAEQLQYAYRVVE
jgi:hypothetical protein